MAPIKRVAHLLICKECGDHGEIIFSDGTKSRSFSSKKDAFEELLVSLATGRVTEAERPHIREEIYQCQLLEEDPLEDLVSLIEEVLAEEKAEFLEPLENDEEMGDEVVH